MQEAHHVHQEPGSSEGRKNLIQGMVENKVKEATGFPNPDLIIWQILSASMPLLFLDDHITIKSLH